MSIELQSSWEPACMEPDELELWRAGAIDGCIACTTEYADGQRKIGRCNGIPGEESTPIIISLEQLADGLPQSKRYPLIKPDGQRNSRSFPPSAFIHTPGRAERKETRMTERPVSIVDKLTDHTKQPELDELSRAAANLARCIENRDDAIAEYEAAVDRLEVAVQAVAPRKRKYTRGNRSGRKTATAQESSG